MAFSLGRYQGHEGQRSSRKRARRLPFFVMLLLAAAVGGIGGIGLTETGIASRILDAAEGWSVTKVAARDFAVCAGSKRYNCIVDGDTFWLDGAKIRISDINTPEIGDPSCAAEARLGRKAQQRLGELLNQGAFELRRADRDVDQYGRKLRVVERNGRSLGAQLVREGLAHEWWGHRQGWC